MKIKVIGMGNIYGKIKEGEIVDAIKHPHEYICMAYDSDGAVWTIYNYKVIEEDAPDTKYRYNVRAMFGDIKTIEFK